MSLREDLFVNRSAGVLVRLFIVNFRVAQQVRSLRGVCGVISIPVRVTTSIFHRFFQVLFNCSIPFGAQIGSGVRWPHGLNGVFITRDARIGRNCVILHQVTIGSNLPQRDRDRAVPVIGDHVFIGAGAKIIGRLTVGDFARVGAQALVVNDVPPNGVARAPQAEIILREAVG